MVTTPSNLTGNRTGLGAQGRRAEQAVRSATAPSKPREANPAAAARHTSANHKTASHRKAKQGGRRPSVPKRDTLFVTLQLAIMLRTGIDIATAIESLSRQSQNKVLRDALRDVHANVSSGISVADAMNRHVNIFGETYVAIVAAGEASGKLPEVLGQLAQLQRGELRLQNSLRALLGYPILLACVCVVVLAALILFVLPNFAQIFADSEVPLPLLTQILLGVAHELRARFWLWLPLIGAAVAGAMSAVRSPSGREFADRFLLQTRLLREVTRATVAGRMFRLLATMLESGVPLLEALALVKGSVGNVAVRHALSAVQNDVLSGRGMSSSLLSANVLPPSAAEMIGMAEQSGSLASVSRLVGEFFEEEAESRLRALVGLLEPLIVVCMGAVVALVVMSVMFPMFDMVNLAKQAG